MTMPAEVRDARVLIYALGPMACSACAPAQLTPEEVTAAVNRQEPTGISSVWQISNEPAFASGEPNPGPCDQDPGTRRHYLLEV
jgi:hypothetical protein